MKVIGCLQITGFLGLVLTLAQSVQAACTASGQVRDLSGHGVYGVSIQYCILNAQGGCSSNLVPFAETDVNGNFSGSIICPFFTHFDYRFFTSEPCYSIAPYSITKTGYSGSAFTITGLDFSAAMFTYHLSGRVADGSGAGLSGVSMIGQYVITDSLGNYSAGLACGASITVTPSHSCYAFIPPSISYTNIQGNHSNQNYTANILTYTISGYVKTAAGAPMAGVTMINLPGNPVTNASGFYSATVPCGATGSVYPKQFTLKFTPATIFYPPVHSDQTNQNYTAVCAFASSSLATEGFGAGWDLSLNVSAYPADCSWGVTGVPSWITINSGSTGTGNGTINITVAANPGTLSRLADLRVGDAQAGKSVFIAQNGQGCTFTFAPPTATYPRTGGSGSYTISTQDTCFWRVQSSQPSWLTVSSVSAADAPFGYEHYIGNSRIEYDISANAGENERNGYIGYPRSFTVKQAGALTPMLPVWIVGTADYFTSLQGAHDGAGNGNTIEAQTMDFAENLAVSKSLTIIGGFDIGYAGKGGYSTIRGLTVYDGSLTVERLVIR